MATSQTRASVGRNGTSGPPTDLFSACSGPLDIEITTAGATQYLDEGVPLAV
jgi:hypothetical protein